MTQEYIGVILPDGIFDRLSAGKKQINVRAYQAAADHFGLTPVFMKLSCLKPGVDQVQGFIKKGKEYGLETVDIPKVIYTRSFLTKKQSRFLEEKKVQFFNKKGIGHNKWEMHEIMSEDPEIAPFLPETVPGTIENLLLMLEKHRQLIMKPAKGSHGGGIMKMTKDKAGRVKLRYPIARRKWKEIQFKEDIPPLITEAFKMKQYIIQENIKLATYKKKPFDLRAVVQRDQTGDWVVAGILCKVSPSRNQFVTNISQGGRSLGFDQVVKEHPYLSHSRVQEDISKLTLKMAKHLESYTDHIADIAFDIALDKKGRPYFIESNFRGRYGNIRYKGKRLEEWKAKHFNPIGYGRFLLDRQT
ncbi:YheC/YheD family protein [Mangrovibacillus sp. Mu-81]|jgi:glutathione synthase/RimK-type ligase-like ATP-grasp enzyme|uniref:YheC/YheD family protein n=1 Tax=Mangrovibacillus sp. Mu-81 TaxID=3121478 RepID=UPI002FE4D4F9